MVIKQDPDQPDCHQGEEDQEEEEDKELLEDQRSQNEVGNIATPREITNFFIISWIFRGKHAVCRRRSRFSCSHLEFLRLIYFKRFFMILSRFSRFSV